MGMFSWECKGCNQELCMDELVRLNGCKGHYDGYGGVGGECIDYNPVAWHQKCYGEATDAEKLDETPSKHARNQGFGFPRQDCMDPDTKYVEPPRVKYADVSSVDVRVYLDGLHAEEAGKEKVPYWFNAGKHQLTNEAGPPVLFTPEDLTPGDFHDAYMGFGDRFEHDYLDEEYLPGGRKARGGEFWGDHDPGQHMFDMIERFGGLHGIISEIAHAVLANAKRRLQA